jgi:hypothetical protein
MMTEAETDTLPLAIALPIHTFCQRWQIAELSVFGSILRDDFDANSDVDFLYFLKPNTHWSLRDLIQAEEELAQLLSRKVDLVAKTSIKQSHKIKGVMMDSLLSQKSDTESVNQQCQSIIHAFQQQLGEVLVALVLFGSRARGDSHAGSDWDLLLVAKELPMKPFERHLYLKRMLPDRWRGQVSILAKTPTEFESSLSPLFLDISLDGVILADTNGYIDQRLMMLRQTIQDKGLYRDRRGQDFVWRWHQQPDLNWELSWEVLS